MVEVGKALQTEQVQNVWTAQGATPGALNPDEMATFVAAEVDRWGKVAKEANITLE